METRQINLPLDTARRWYEQGGELREMALGAFDEKELINSAFPDYHDTQKHIVLMKLHLLRDEYRNGWLPDWKEQSVKHTILIDHDDIVVGKSYVISCFLAFQTEELAEEFLNNFRELIEEAGDLI